MRLVEEGLCHSHSALLTRNDRYELEHRCRHRCRLRNGRDELTQHGWMLSEKRNPPRGPDVHPSPGVVKLIGKRAWPNGTGPLKPDGEAD